MARPTPIPPKPERVNAGIRFTRPTLERLHHEARERGLSVNRLVEMACEDFLERKPIRRMRRS